MINSEPGGTRVRLIVSGRVQGVFFRASAADYARKLGVTGYARNLWDGTVEIVAEGSAAKLELLEAWANKGPAHAKVDRVTSEWDDSLDEFNSFRIA